MADRDKLFLLTNDDGINAKGLHSLIDVVRSMGKVFVIAPDQGQSGMSHAITVKYPIRIQKQKEEEGLTIYSCNGTPVDCIKLALNKLLDRMPDIILSGINHGSNSSSSIVYSGTMAAAIEGCINGIPSVGFSLLDYSPEADFSGAKKYAATIINNVISKGLHEGTCLNVNIPVNHTNEIKGIRICRQNKGVWREEFDQRTDPQNRDYFWLTGEYFNLEPDAGDTDEWALKNGYVSVVPVHVDLTSYESLDYLKSWEFNLERKNLE
jgi:5'-nucleotidase